MYRSFVMPNFPISLVVFVVFLKAIKSCNYDQFKYSIPNATPIIFQNNSFLHLNDLTSNKGIQSCLYMLVSEWFYPNGDSVGPPSKGIGAYSNLNFILRAGLTQAECTSIQYCQTGIYKCNRTDHSILLLGVYKNDTNEVLRPSLTLDMNVVDYFSPSVSLTIKCLTFNYPPTSITWLKGKNSIDNIVCTSTLINATTSEYISSTTFESSTNNTSGEYSCAVNSTSLSTYHYDISTPITIEDPPVIVLIEYLNESAIRFEWQHSNDVFTYDHLIAYKKTHNSSEVYCVECGTINRCDLNNLTEGLTYSLVIAPNEGSSNQFQITTPYLFTISAPDIVNIIKAAEILNDDLSRSLLILWSPFTYVATVSIMYSGTCCSSNIDFVCINELKITATNPDNLTLNSLVPGIEYKLLIWGENALGRGPYNPLTINLTKTVPISNAPLECITDVTYSSINVSWTLLTCCNFSGEAPMYTVDLSTNGTEVYNDTVDEHYYLFDELEPLTEYRITIGAINSIGVGWTEIINVYTLDNSTSSKSTGISTSATTIVTPTRDPTASSDWIVIGLVAGAVTGIITIVFCVIVVVVIIVLKSKRTKEDPSLNIHRLAATQSMEMLDYEYKNGVHQQANLLNSKYQAPYLIEFPTDTKAAIGETVHFLVHVEGYPQPSLSWEYQGEPVTSLGPIQIFTDGSLILNDVKTQYSGRYTFVAGNPAGKINRVVNLQVVSEEESCEDDEENEKSKSCRSVLIEHKPIPIELLEKYVETHHEYDNDPFQFLFSSLRKYPERYSFKEGTENKGKNRYKSIIPYDSNIVELAPIEGWKNFEHTYINASYIDGFDTSRKFIATQGPIPETVSDFWRMVRQLKCPIIVCLTNIHEGNKIKCEQYWPESTNKPENHGPYIIKLLSEELNSNFIVRNMEILCTDGSQDVVCVRQFHFTSWPDHGVPEHGSPLIQFRQKVMHHYRRISSLEVGPIVVHCSAGVGRTGTFIALDIALEQIENTRELDLVGIVNHMREQRTKMVQITKQLIFLHDIILEFTLCGSTMIPIVKLSEAMTRLYSETPNSTKTGFETQFQLIQRLTPKLNKYKCSVGTQYIEKNHPNVPLPPDSRRVILYGQTPDYINASFVDGYEEKKAFIIAQSPLQHTVIDFWRMIIQQKTAVVLMLCELSENSKVVCHRYWPIDGNEAEVYGYFSIKLLGQKTVSDNLFKRTLGVKDMNTGKSQVVTQIQVTNWLPDGQCVNHQCISEIYTEVTTSQRSRSEATTSPMVIHCSNCITRSGMYCATHIAIDQARLEQIVDIFQTVKSVRLQRPGSVPTEDNYATVHDFVKAYFTSFEIYQMQGIHIYDSGNYY